ncbi:MAG: AAA family ATPase [Clostridia bacterium]
MGYLCKCEREKVNPDIYKTIFGKVRNVFNTLFSEIDIIIDEESNNSIKCIKQGNKYGINALSEGEKAVLYYSISVFVAKDDGFIIIDEPETYLNPSITNILWDLLIKEKNNCQFIFITHSIDFVLGRTNKIIAWIKDYKYPNK